MENRPDEDYELFPEIFSGKEGKMLKNVLFVFAIPLAGLWFHLIQLANYAK